MTAKEREWKAIQKFCRHFGKDGETDFSRYLTESWFSNTLSWLLNPKESHGFGVKFSQLFLKEIAKERTKGHRPWYADSTHEYAHRATMLKWRKSTQNGKSPLGLSLKNAFPVTEFFLSRDPGIKRDKRIPSYIDVLFMDLDLKDGLVVVIENKLFTVDHDNQLDCYYDSIERKFSTTPIREYVYLTLLGDAPRQIKAETQSKWVCLSWLETILGILEQLAGSDKVDADVEKLMRLLRWLESCHPEKVPVKRVLAFRKLLQEQATECLLEELNRLGEGKRGSWGPPQRRQRIAHTLRHSSYPARELQVRLLPNLTITISGRDAKGGLFEKVIVPFGCNADQTFNLLDLAAKDIYLQFFTHPELYLASKRRLRRRSPAKQKNKPFFDFICEYSTALLLILQISSTTGTVAAKK